MALDFIRSKTFKKQPEDDLGFGSKVGREGERLVNKDGSFNVKRTGYHSFAPYLWMMETTWPWFLFTILISYILLNIVFAFAFMSLGIETVTHLPSQGFWQDFAHAYFFSIQTYTTVGYGTLNPIGFAANFIASLDALVGLLSFALATGLLFGRVSKPRSQILFSENAIIRPFEGANAFMFRIVNKRNHKVSNVKTTVVMTWQENQNGETKRRFSTLPLERDQVALLPLNWTIVHVIDKESPLLDADNEDLKAMNAEFIIQVEGYDRTFDHQIHSNTSYVAEDIVCNAVFAPMFFSRDGHTELDLSKLNDLV
ncbi:MAG: transporter [Balneolaceae bacterium]|nr:transporter [Balneolaceae bacterium]